MGQKDKSMDAEEADGGTLEDGCGPFKEKGEEREALTKVCCLLEKRKKLLGASCSEREEKSML